MKISVRVKPGSKGVTRLEQQEDGSYVAFLHARAHDGEANKALIELIAKEFHIAKTQITITSGAKSRQKVLEWWSSSGMRRQYQKNCQYVRSMAFFL